MIPSHSFNKYFGVKGLRFFTYSRIMSVFSADNVRVFAETDQIITNYDNGGENLMKKLVAILLTLVLCLAAVSALADGKSYADIKVGFLFLHDENSTYDLNFINGAKEACEKLGVVNYDLRTGIDESEACYEAAADFADKGYDIVFADSFGHEDYMIQAAKEFPNTQFCHATGTRAHTEGLSNFHNAFASIYEGRYLGRRDRLA